MPSSARGFGGFFFSLGLITPGLSPCSPSPENVEIVVDSHTQPVASSNQLNEGHGTRRLTRRQSTGERVSAAVLSA